MEVFVGDEDLPQHNQDDKRNKYDAFEADCDRYTIIVKVKGVGEEKAAVDHLVEKDEESGAQDGARSASSDRGEWC